MAAIDENLEQRVAESRGRMRQNKAVPWLIRDPDGSLWPNVPNIAKKQNMRPYHGPLDASQEQRLQYLQGHVRRRVVVTAATEPEPFDLAKCTKDEIIAFAEEEYGYTLDPEKDLEDLRKELAGVAGVEYETPAAPRARAVRGLGGRKAPAANAEA